jgi:hypothetical protein|tara:strand:+ start:2644 stop:3030 length:387 start_codon:yes stop_codon:yes gene_type:complete
MLIILLLTITNMFNCTLLPCIGNNYVGKVSIPYIGKQNIKLFQIERKKSLLTLEGIINIEGIIYYNYFNRKTKKYDYILDDNLNNIMKKYKCDLINSFYDKKKDECFVKINIKLLRIKKSIILVRVLE